MTRQSIARVGARGVVLALVPFVWMLGLTGIPSRSAVIAARTADTLGVWLFTWSLIWIASAAAVAIAWACWSWDREAAKAANHKTAA